jgi:hypothetical protein
MKASMIDTSVSYHDTDSLSSGRFEAARLERIDLSPGRVGLAANLKGHAIQPGRTYIALV